MNLDHPCAEGACLPAGRPVPFLHIWRLACRRRLPTVYPSAEMKYLLCTPVSPCLCGEEKSSTSLRTPLTPKGVQRARTPAASPPVPSLRIWRPARQREPLRDLP